MFGAGTAVVTGPGEAGACCVVDAGTPVGPAADGAVRAAVEAGADAAAVGAGEDATPPDDEGPAVGLDDPTAGELGATAPVVAGGVVAAPPLQADVTATAARAAATSTPRTGPPTVRPPFPPLLSSIPTRTPRFDRPSTDPISRPFFLLFHRNSTFRHSDQ